MNGEKSVQIEVVGNAYKLQLMASDPVIGGVPYPHGKPVVVLDTVSDEVLGQSVRNVFRTRIRSPRTKAPAAAGGAE
ncbi:MAG TPA: hypothetical protein PK416_03065 [Thermodesulfobacteriota bacterium]|nr:hypothetical protein [Thermodesulfobacteriota bacterium]